jgi:hypothetical protein
MWVVPAFAGWQRSQGGVQFPTNLFHYVPISKIGLQPSWNVRKKLSIQE